MVTMKMVCFAFFFLSIKGGVRLYQVLYRKWRPTVFADVVGQPQVTQTLQNELSAGRIAHAYLFTGSRGTGKTTCAKILAKAVNCLAPVNGDPCGVCDICKQANEGSLLDIVEIDAASNNGVDNIRDLRDETAYTPSVCTYKVYIIDEVHMLSTPAFNALLKIMEEPPSHFFNDTATTEIYTIGCTKRLIGNYMFTCDDLPGQTVVGFENHSGKTYLGSGVSPLGKVLVGGGNNGEDGYEGVRYQNVFGTYSHGPVLPKNPAFCDHLLTTALQQRYPNLELQPLDDAAELAAHNTMRDRLLKK